MGTGFKEFIQTPRGMGFSLLGFYTLFNSALNDRLIGPKAWDRIDLISWTQCVQSELIIHYALNHVLICMRP